MNYPEMVRHAGLVIIVAMSARIVAHAVYEVSDRIHVQTMVLRGIDNSLHSIHAIAEHNETMGMELIHDLQGGNDDEILAETPDE